MEKDDELGLRKAKDRNQFVTQIESPGVQSGDNQVKTWPAGPSQGPGSPGTLQGGRNSDGGGAGRKAEVLRRCGSGVAEAEHRTCVPWTRQQGRRKV